MGLSIADTNEFHPLGDAHAYAGGSPVIILRAHNGYREDEVYAANVAAVYAEPGIASCGHYGYLPKEVDARSAGVAFGETVKKHGGLRRQDFIACDDEEGAGDQSPRVAAWLDGTHSVLGEQQAQDWGYSGASFWSAHLAGCTVRNRWIASYGVAQAPALGEKLWQDTDAGTFAGIPSKCDGSKFAGTLADFLALIGAVAAAPAAAGASSIVGMAEAPDGAGYWLVGPDGGVFSHGEPFHGSTGGAALNAPVVGIAAGLAGYWLAAADGGVFNYGERFLGSVAGVKLAAPVVGIVGTESGRGYFLVAADGGVFNFGDAHACGSLAGTKLAKPIVGAARCPGSPGGLWLAAADGGVFCLGQAPFKGSAGGTKLAKPVVGIAAAPGGGYWLAAADGGVFAFGAPFYGSAGSVKLAKPIVGIQASPSGKGYGLVAADGGVFAFGDFRFAGAGA